MTSSKVLKFFGCIFFALAIIFSLTNTTGDPRGLDDDIECGSLLSPGEDLEDEDKTTTFMGRTIDLPSRFYSMDPENEYCDERRDSRKNQVILLAVIGTLTFAAGYFGFGSKSSNENTSRRSGGSYTEGRRVGEQPRSSSATDMSATDSRVSNTRKEKPVTQNPTSGFLRNSMVREDKEESADNAEINFCSSCGRKVEPDDVFCSSCGKKIK